MEVPMQDVAGVACAPARARWTRTPPVAPRVARRRRVLSFAAPALAATVAAALLLHLLAELVRLMPAADPMGALSLLAGMAVVLVTLTPFTVLWARRAQHAWAAIWPVERRR